MASQTTSITLGATALQAVRDPAANNVSEYYGKEHVIAVVPIFNQRPPNVTDWEWGYPYPTMTIINIILKNHTLPYLRIELQDISNQPTWSTGLLTGIQQAVADIGAWMV